ncbi:MAG: V-type ATP synthase subunit I [Lachnospiraceae bacterium]|nr:V-type ATP synthase subunit I [Lachnospiraceae bacterium]
MAVVEMQKLSVCALRKNRKAILEALQRMGVMEIETHAVQEEGLEVMDTAASRTSFLKCVERLDSALDLLKSYAPEKEGLLSSLAGKQEVTSKECEAAIADKDAILEVANRMNACEKEIQECRGTIQKLQTRIEQMALWMPLDVSMSFSGTAQTAAFIGTLPCVCDEAALYAYASEGMEDPAAISTQIVYTEKDAVGVFVLCLKQDKKTVEDNLRKHGFARPAQIENGIPAEVATKLAARVEENEKQIATLKEEVASHKDMKDRFKILSDYFRNRAEKYRQLGMIPQTENAFFLEGWVPKAQAADVSALLSDKFDAVVETQDPGPKEEPPVMLHNNKFSQVVEGVLASYGLPQKGRLDPTFIMSIFYVIFFGMMLSDAGYGIVMAIGCGIVLLKFKKLDPGLKKSIQLFFWCGLSTTFWGFMYGGFFGDLIQVVATTYFGYTGGPILKPLWFEPIKDPMKLLMYCLLFGLIHLMTGLILQGVESLRHKDVVGFICDTLSWFMLVLGLVLILLPTDLFGGMAGTTFVFPPFVVTASYVMTVAGLLIILVMSGRRKKNKWPLRLALGLYDIYGITSWLSDVLSYSRLLALGLATGVIASIVNMMASMFGTGPVGPVIFIVICLFGHILNLAINALGAYVHTNRLQYVEFFGKFYEGGGEAFKPFNTDNKYIDIKEES